MKQVSVLWSRSAIIMFFMSLLTGTIRYPFRTHKYATLNTTSQLTRPESKQSSVRANYSNKTTHAENK